MFVCLIAILPDRFSLNLIGLCHKISGEFYCGFDLTNTLSVLSNIRTCPTSSVY